MMKFDTTLLTHQLDDIPAMARAAQALGFDGIWTSETAHDAFLPLLLAAEHTRTLTVGTSIAVAFPRSPAILAHMSWDLARFSRGRFILGLGTQVKGHNLRRLGAPWDHPLRRMREVILSLRAFWTCWQHGTPLDFQGEFYRFNLMTPFFSPPPHDHWQIPIYLAAVNPGMCRLAGALCQGVHVHPFHSVKYLKELVLPNVQQGLSQTGRAREEITLSSTVFVIPNDDRQQAQAYEQSVRQQIAFYASTPAYRVVFQTHGWDAVAQQLSALAARGRWAEMPELVSDEILDTFALWDSWAKLPAQVLASYRGRLLDRVSYYFPFVPSEHDAAWTASIQGFRGQ